MAETLYLKWRPQRFADVVGQERVVDVLKNQSATGNFSHAYLFTGTRGTGKTTCARILAKAINCPEKIDGDPCGVCPVCRGIENGENLDVVEMDAASNNGIEDMRDLKEKSVYNPTAGRYKVYIIDEVHMLSVAAFNGFLKLLEEPPEHVIFILATTDVQKLPATILSRCQRFDFRRIDEKDIQKRLLYVAAEEKIDLTPEGAAKIASLSDGAMRNALSALEQLAGAGKTVDAETVSAFLGLAGSETLLKIANAVARQDAATALSGLDELYTRGVSAANFLKDLALLFRDASICKAGAPVELLGGGYHKEDLKEIASQLGYDRLIYHMEDVGRTAAGLRNAVNARVDTELCLLRLTNPSGKTPQALLARLDALEKRLDALSTGAVPIAAPQPVQPIAPSQPPEDDRPPIPEEAPPAAGEETVSTPPSAPKESAPSALTPYAGSDALMKGMKGGLHLLAYTQFMQTKLLSDGKRLIIVCANAAQKDFLEEGAVLQKISAKASEISGVPLQASCRVEGEAEEEKPKDGFKDIIKFGREHPDIAEIR